MVSESNAMLSHQQRQVVCEDKAKLKLNINSLSSHKNSIWFKDVSSTKSCSEEDVKILFFNWELKDKISSNKPSGPNCSKYG